MNIIAYETVTVEAEGVVIDLLIWRRFRRPMIGLLEALLELPANQHLADLPAVLPLGTVVTIPVPQERETNAVPITSLWN